MTERIHFLPVGFDFDRLIHPISKGSLEADRVIIVHDERDKADDQSEAAELAGNIVRRLEESFDLIDITVDWLAIEHEEMFDYERMYPKAYECLLDELRAGNEVFVNISSMPRTVGFAFATAADSLITENQGEIEDIRQRLHTYYVRPERYLVHELIEELEDEVEYLGKIHDSQASKRRAQLQAKIDKVKEGGVTEGTKAPPGTDKMYVEFPASPGSEIEETEKRILRFLSDREETMSSTSELAKSLAREEDEEYDDSYRSKIQYNVTRLEEKGYVDRNEEGNRKVTKLSTMGRMWVKTHETAVSGSEGR